MNLTPLAAINIHEAKTHLSRLVEQAALGHSFIIAKAGKPMVQVIPLALSIQIKKSRLGFMPKQTPIPKDFDQMGGDEIEQLFHAHSA